MKEVFFFFLILLQGQSTPIMFSSGTLAECNGLRYAILSEGFIPYTALVTECSKHPWSQPEQKSKDLSKSDPTGRPG